MNLLSWLRLLEPGKYRIQQTELIGWALSSEVDQKQRVRLFILRRGDLSCGNIGANMMLWQIEASCENWQGVKPLKSLRNKKCLE